MTVSREMCRTAHPYVIFPDLLRNVEDDKRAFWKKRLTDVEDGLRYYSNPPASEPDSNLPLLRLEEIYNGHSHYGHLMGALMDLKLTCRFAVTDFVSGSALYNEELHFEKIPGKSPEEILGSKIRFLEKINAYVLRLRALWDKLMGILVLKFSPDSYKKFIDGFSRKSEFARLMRGHLSDSSIDGIISLVTILDEKFRTAEAHGSGTLRNWIFTAWDPNPINTPFGQLLGLYNQTFDYVRQISDLLLGDGKDT